MNKKFNMTPIYVILGLAIIILCAMIFMKAANLRKQAEQEPSSQPAPSSSEPSSEPESVPSIVELTLSEQELNDYLEQSGYAGDMAKELKIELLDEGRFSLSGKVDLTAVASGERTGALALLPEAALKNLPVSAQGSVSLNSDSQVDIDISEVKVSAITLPDSLTGEIKAYVEDALSEAINSAAGVSLSELTISDGKLYIKGTVED